MGRRGSEEPALSDWNPLASAGGRIARSPEQVTPSPAEILVIISWKKKLDATDSRPDLKIRFTRIREWTGMPRPEEVITSASGVSAFCSSFSIDGC